LKSIRSGVTGTVTATAQHGSEAHILTVGISFFKGLAGVLASANRILTKVLVGGERESTAIFFLISLIILTICLLIFPRVRQGLFIFPRVRQGLLISSEGWKGEFSSLQKKGMEGSHL
jgi:archaellum biogenesis protein FlaJ (TadC family)